MLNPAAFFALSPIKYFFNVTKYIKFEQNIKALLLL